MGGNLLDDGSSDEGLVLGLLREGAGNLEAGLVDLRLQRQLELQVVALARSIGA
jgi:hypothetical protein